MERSARSGDVIGCGLRRNSTLLPTQFTMWPKQWPKLIAWVSRQRYTTASDCNYQISHAFPIFLAYVPKHWEALGTRLSSSTVLARLNFNLLYHYTDMSFPWSLQNLLPSPHPTPSTSKQLWLHVLAGHHVTTDIPTSIEYFLCDHSTPLNIKLNST